MIYSSDDEQTDSAQNRDDFNDSNRNIQQAPEVPARPAGITQSNLDNISEPEFKNIEIDALNPYASASSTQMYQENDINSPVSESNNNNHTISDPSLQLNDILDSESSESSLEEIDAESATDDTQTSKMLPPLAEQRALVVELFEQDAIDRKRGDDMYFVPEQWFRSFWSGTDEELFADPYEYLGPIDLDPHVDDYENFIIKDRSSITAVCRPIMLKLVEWYGLKSQALRTFLITNPEFDTENDQPYNSLIVDWDWITIYLYVFVQEAFNTTSKKPILFSISRAANVGIIIDKCKNYLNNHEKFDLQHFKHRFWLHLIDEANSQEIQEYSDKFLLLPSDFIKFESLTPVKSKDYNQDLESIPLIQSFFIFAEFKQKDHWPSNYYIYNKELSASGTKGLNNLGNTCYMNSALQCLAHIPEIQEYFENECYLKEINAKNPLGYEGNIASSFGDLIKELYNKNTASSVSYSPRYFKSCIGYCNSMFQGYLQQDSQEFITFLLDGLHEDLNRVLEKPYVEKAELKPGFDINDKSLIEQLAIDTWTKHKLRNDSIILDLFVGLYKSTLKCPSCENVSLTFDPYNDLTLPLPVQNFWGTTVLIFPLNHAPIYMEVELQKKSVYKDLKAYVARNLNRPADNYVGYECYNNQIYKSYDSENSEASYLPLPDLIGPQDRVVFVEIGAIEKGDIIVPVINTNKLADEQLSKAFGYPTFIKISKEENLSFGKLKYKILKALQALSGVEIFDQVEEQKIESLKFKFEEKIQFLKESLHIADSPELDTRLMEEFEFWKVGYNDSCSIKLLSQGNSNISQSSDMMPKVWAPRNLYNFNKATELIDTAGPLFSSLYKPDIMENENNHRLNDILDEADVFDKNVITVDKTSTDDLGFTQLENTQTNIDLPAENGTANSDDEAMEILESIVPGGFTEPEIDSYDVSNGVTTTEDLLEAKVLDGLSTIIIEWNNIPYDKLNTFVWEAPKEFINQELLGIKQKRLAAKNEHISLDDCLNLFSKPEILGESDLWYCPVCKEHTQATKQIQLWSTPDILLVHLKRFENQSSFSDKINDTVDFPIVDFDVSPYLVHKDSQEHLYDLFAVDNHYGGLGGGHYTSYVKNCVDNKWYYFDDSRVSEAKPEDSISGSAYLLFYRRKTSGLLGGTKINELIEQGREEHRKYEELFMKSQMVMYEETKSDLENEYEENELSDESGDESDDESDDEKEDDQLLNQENTDSLGAVSLSSDLPINAEQDSENFPENRNTNPLPVGNETGDCDSSNSERRKIRLISTKNLE